MRPCLGRWADLLFVLVTDDFLNVLLIIFYRPSFISSNVIQQNNELNNYSGNHLNVSHTVDISKQYFSLFRQHIFKLLKVKIDIRFQN